MDTVRTVEEMQQLADRWRREGQTIGLVPTMGCLHEGHLKLVDLARGQATRVVVSIFVNPIQFGPHEDFDRYPRDEKGDLEKLAARGVDAVFLPSVDEMYGPGHETYVDCTKLPDHLCGLRREGHFRGVTTVVLKLFMAVLPHAAVFGQKDYQQLLVISKMVRDLSIPVRVVPGETVREADGLAMSSRNAYLAPEERKRATCLHRALLLARRMADAGEVDASAIRRAMADVVGQAGGKVDYVAVVDPETLEELDRVGERAHAAIAAFVSKVRLIDNLRLKG
jgi:pantoate--beta-alanine ligase